MDIKKKKKAKIFVNFLQHLLQTLEHTCKNHRGIKDPPWTKSNISWYSVKYEDASAVSPRLACPL